jgi:hypothetical protein
MVQGGHIKMNNKLSIISIVLSSLALLSVALIPTNVYSNFNYNMDIPRNLLNQVSDANVLVFTDHEVNATDIESITGKNSIDRLIKNYPLADGTKADIVVLKSGKSVDLSKSSSIANMYPNKNIESRIGLPETIKPPQHVEGGK